MISMDMIREAHEVVKAAGAVYTPVLNIPKIAENLYVKCENLQKTGSFKLRGATYKISKLTDAEKAAGVIAASAGNHAQGVALSATNMGVKSVICMPAGAPLAKVEATKGYGAEVVLVPGAFDDAAAKAVELQKEFGYTFAHPYNDDYVMAGQGTIGLELIDQMKDVEVVVVPIGGGGLISGVAFALKSLNPNIKVYGVQAAGAPSMKNSVEHKQIERLDSVSTIADGIAVKQPGENTFEFCSKYVDGIVTVTDDEVSSAILSMLEHQKIITEGAGAVAAAAVMFDKVPVEGKNAICVVSGGNIDVNILDRVIKRGLFTSGRSALLKVELLDKPGQLVQVSKIIADLGGNVIGVHHERTNANTGVTGCWIRIDLETRNFEHISKIKTALIDAGFRILD